MAIPSGRFPVLNEQLSDPVIFEGPRAMPFPLTKAMIPLAVTVALCLAAALAATEVEKKADACFCLSHLATKSVLHLGCRKATPPNKYTAEITCMNSDDGSEYKVENAKGFEEISEGGSGCSPCKPAIAPPNRPRHPRTNDGAEESQ